MGLRGADTARPPAAWIWWRQGWDPPPRCVSGCCAKSLSHVRLCDPMNGSPPGFSVHGILQARILEWVAMPSSRGPSQPRDQTQVSCMAGIFLPSEPLGNPRRLKWVAYPFSRGSSQPRNLYLMDSLPPELPGKPSLPLLGPTRESELLMCLRKKWFCILPGVFVITVGTQLSPTFKILSGS